MAHFLSEVTHQRLEQREGTGETVFSGGVTITHDFDCQARCVEVIPSIVEAGPLSDISIWTGNIDGSIAIRKGLDGKPVATIQGRKNIFIYSLLAHGDCMWAGQSDGYITIFNLQSGERLCEIKGHIGAVNCILMVDGKIFTGGSDWQICLWDPSTLNRVAHGQFSGHQNAVRCLVAEPGVLYSGGDDHTIRAWDLASGLEKDTPWPIIAHENTVRAIALFEVYLFSSSTDGSIKVWNTQTAQLVRQLDERQAAVNTLLLDRPNGRLWSGATDGTVSLWDASNLSLVGQINTHHNTHVALIKEVARINAVKAWTVGEDGVIRMWYSDNDPITADFEALADMEASFQQQVEVHRAKVIDNYRQLENAKMKLQELEALDQRKKLLVSEVLGHTKRKESLAQHASHALHWLHKYRQQVHRSRICDALVAKNGNRLRRVKFSQLLQFTRQRKEVRRKAALVAHLQITHREHLRNVYLVNMVEHHRRTVMCRQRAALALATSCATAKHTLCHSYHIWQRYVMRRKQSRKQAQVVKVVVSKVDTALAAIYWARLEKCATMERHQVKVSRFVSLFGGLCQKQLLSYYFCQLARNAQRRAQAREVAAVARSLVAVTDGCVLRDAYHKLANFAKQRRAHEALANVMSQRDLIRDMEGKLEASRGYTEAQLEAELREKQLELASILQGNREIDLQIRALEARNKDLQRDLLKDVSLEHDKPPLDVLAQAMHFLKARGVNVYHDLETIQKAREASKATSPAQVYEDGVGVVRRTCQSIIRPQRLKESNSYDWLIGDLFARITKRNLGKANIGICQLVTAYDMLNAQQLNAWLSKDSSEDPWGPKHKHNNEVLGNFGVFLEIALRQYRIHRNEDPLTGAPLVPLQEKNARSRATSPRGRSRSRSRSRSAAKEEGKGRVKSAPPRGKAQSRAPSASTALESEEKKGSRKVKGKKKRSKSAPSSKAKRASSGKTKVKKNVVSKKEGKQARAS